MPNDPIFYEVQELAKLIWGDRNQYSGFPWGQGVELEGYKFLG